MKLTLNIPARAEAALRDAWGDELDRAAFEALAIESYRSARLSAGELAEMLGLSSSIEAVAWLSRRKVPVNYDTDDLEADRRTLHADRPGTLP